MDECMIDYSSFTSNVQKISEARFKIAVDSQGFGTCWITVRYATKLIPCIDAPRMLLLGYIMIPCYFEPMTCSYGLLWSYIMDNLLDHFA